jgi:hypothetical protein
LEMVIRYDHTEQGHLSIRLLWLQLHWKPLKVSYKCWRRSLQLPDMQLSSLELWDIVGNEVNEWGCIVMSSEVPFSNRTVLNGMFIIMSCHSILNDKVFLWRALWPGFIQLGHTSCALIMLRDTIILMYYKWKTPGLILLAFHHV